MATLQATEVSDVRASIAVILPSLRDDSRISVLEKGAFSRLLDRLDALTALQDDPTLDILLATNKDNRDTIQSFLQDGTRGTAAIVLSGELSVHTASDATASYGRGYLISSLDRFFGKNENTRHAFSNDFQAVLISSRQLKIWLRDDEFKKAFAEVVAAQNPIARSTELHKKTLQGLRDDNRKQRISSRLHSTVSKLMKVLNPDSDTVKYNDPGYIESWKKILSPGQQRLYMQRKLASLMIDPALFDTYEDVRQRWDEIYAKAGSLSDHYHSDQYKRLPGRDKATLIFKAIENYLDTQRYLLRASVIPQEVIQQLENLGVSEDAFDRIKSLATEAEWLHRLVSVFSDEYSDSNNLNVIDWMPDSENPHLSFAEAIVENLDKKIQFLTNALREHDPDEFEFIGVQQYDVQPFLHISTSGQMVLLPEDRQPHKVVNELLERLDNGEISAVDQRLYGLGRITPEVILYVASETDCPIYFVDGTKDDAIRHIMIEHGALPTDPNVPMGVTVLNLTGQSGKNPKFIMSWQDGRMALVVTYPAGIERVTSYALGLAMYTGPNANRIDTSRFKFLQSSTQVSERFRIEMGAHPPVPLEEEVALSIFNRPEDLQKRLVLIQ